MAYRTLTGIGGSPSDPVYTYASSLHHDIHIKPYVLRILKAHTLHLAEKKIIPGEAAEKVLEALNRLEEEEPPPQGYEDIYEWIEARLEELAGRNAKYIWIGRSRNDHVAAALRLYTRDRLRDTIRWIGEAIGALEKLQREYKGVIIPLHTHRQPSQIGTVDCLIAAWIEGLERSRAILEHAISMLSQGPLGSGAGAGTVAPIDAVELNVLAGFTGALQTSVYATGSRLDLAYAADAAAVFMAEASRIAGDLILYSSPYVGVVELPPAHVATSSIMPHKRNPATMEVLLGKTHVVVSCAAAYKHIYTGLPSGYSLDLQEGNPCLYTVLETTVQTARILADLLPGLRVDVERARELVEKYPIWSAEAAEMMALEEGTPLREAYARVAEEIRRGAGRLSPEEVLGKRRRGPPRGCTL